METPEQLAQLRHVVRQAHQLPEPTWNLMARVTRRKSRLQEPRVSLEQQKKQSKKNGDKAPQGGTK